MGDYKEAMTTGKGWERFWPPELPYDYNAMTLEKALIMIEGAKKKAQQIGIAMIISICDAAGNLVALEKMDDAPILCLEVAINKARTAVLGKIPSHFWGGFFKGPDPVLAPLWFHTGWITWMGGFPVVVGGKLIGGIGCSGGSWEDGVTGRAGLKALGADLSGAEACLMDIKLPAEMW